MPGLIEPAWQMYWESICDGIDLRSSPGVEQLMRDTFFAGVALVVSKMNQADEDGPFAELAGLEVNQMREEMAEWAAHNAERLGLSIGEDDADGD